jgi:hypothetical protein
MRQETELQKMERLLEEYKADKDIREEVDEWSDTVSSGIWTIFQHEISKFESNKQLVIKDDIEPVHYDTNNRTST